MPGEKVRVGTVASGTRFRPSYGGVYTATAERRDMDTPAADGQWADGVIAISDDGRRVNFDPSVMVELVEVQHAE